MKSRSGLTVAAVLAVVLTTPVTKAAQTLPSPVVDTVVNDILSNVSRTKGLCLDLACGSGQIALKMAQDTGYYVHAFETTFPLVDEARANLRSSGIYASELHVEKGALTKLPYPDHTIDLVIRGDLFLDGLKGIDWSEVERVLAPGGVAYVGQSNAVSGSYTLTSAELNNQLAAAGIADYAVITTNGVWAKITKARPAGMGGWSHAVRQDRGMGAAHQIRGSSHNRGAVDDDLARGPYTVGFVCGPVGNKGYVQTMSEGRYILRWGGILRPDGSPDRIQVFSGYNGMFLWEVNLTHNDGHGMVCVGDWVVVAEGANAAAPVNCLTVLDAETGTQLWSKSPADVAPGMAKWTLYAVDYDGVNSRHVLVAGCCDEIDGKNFDYLVALNPQNGSEYWNYTPTADGEAFVVGNDMVFVSDAGASLNARNLSNGSQAWNTPGANNAALRYWPGQNWVIAGSTAYNASNGVQARTGVNGNIIAGNNHLGGGLGRYALSDGHHYYIGNFSARDVASQASLGQFYNYGDPSHPKMLQPADYTHGLDYVRCYGLTGSTHNVFTNYKGLVIGNVDSLTDGAAQKWYTYDSLCRPDCDTNAIAGNGRVLCPTTGCPCDLNIKSSIALSPMPKSEYQAAINQSVQLEHGPAYSDTITYNADPAAWPAFRHDSAHTGITGDTLTLPLAVNWETQLAGALTPPVAADGCVFTASDNHSVYALDAGTGQLLWQYTTGGAVYRAPAYWQGRLYVGSMDGYCYCLKAATGELIWRFRGAPNARYFNLYTRPISVWPLSGGVVVDNGKVNFYAGLTTGDRVFIYSLNAATGAIDWGNDLAGRAVDFMPTQEVDGYTIAKTGASPFGMNPWGVLAASDTTLFVPQGLRPPGGMDRGTGAVKWFGHRGDSQQRSNFHIQWKSSIWRSAGGNTVVLGGAEWVFAGGYNWLAQRNQEFKIYRQDNGRQMYQDHVNLFIKDTNQFRDSTPGPTFGEAIANEWGHSPISAGGTSDAPVLDTNAGPAYPDGLLYRTVNTGIYDFAKLKQVQLGQLADADAKVASLDAGTVLLTAARHVVGRIGQNYRIYTKGTYTLEQSVNSSATAGDRITDGMAVSNGNLIASTQNSYVVCFSTFATGGTHAVSGRITGDVNPNIKVSLDGPCRTSVTINGDGTYAFANLVDGSYTVMPVMPGYTFTPPNRTVNVSGADVPNVDFAATAIVGDVTPPALAVTACNLTGTAFDASMPVQVTVDGSGVPVSSGDWTATDVDISTSPKTIVIIAADSASNQTTLNLGILY